MLSDQEPVIVVRHCRQNLPRQKMTADLSKGKAPYVQKNQSKSDSEQAGHTKYIAEKDATKTKTVEVTRIESKKAVVISIDTKSAQTIKQAAVMTTRHQSRGYYPPKSSTNH